MTPVLESETQDIRARPKIFEAFGNRIFEIPKILPTNLGLIMFG